MNSTGDDALQPAQQQMQQDPQHVLQQAIDSVDEFFDGVFAPLDEWLPRLRALLEDATAKGRLTGTQLATLVEADSHAILDHADRPIYGAGYCASDAVVAEGNPLAWWQGADRSLLSSSTFGPGQAAIDLGRLEWFRVPQATGERHVAGPFVDYLCSNEITITSAVPVNLGGDFVGVVCADVLVSSLESALPRVAEVPGAVLLNSGGRVVVSNDPDLDTGDRFAGWEALDDLGKRVVRSAKYPFALHAP